MPSTRTRVELYYSSRFEVDPRGVTFCPGRLVLFRDARRALTAPTEEGVYVAHGVRPDRRVVLHALNARETDTFDPDRALRSGRRWADLVRGVFAAFSAEGRRVPGLNLAVLGDLPVGRGLASSTAYVGAVLRALARTLSDDEAPSPSAGFVARAEGGDVVDALSVLAARPRHALRIDVETLAHDHLALPPDTRLEHVPNRTPQPMPRDDANLDEALEALRTADGERLGALMSASSKADAEVARIRNEDGVLGARQQGGSLLILRRIPSTAG